MLIRSLEITNAAILMPHTDGTYAILPTPSAQDNAGSLV